MRNPFRRSLTAAEPKLRPRSELGVTGTLNLNGFLTSTEYRPELQGKTGLQTIDEMLRSDGTVQEALEHLVSPIKNASWEIEPASDDPEHLEQAAAVRCAYFEDLDPPWIESLDEQLDYLPYGHAVFEVVEQITESELSYDDPAGGDQITIPARQYLSLDSFQPRLQQTLYRWNVEAGKLVSITQLTIPYGDEIELPLDRLLYLSYKRRGSEWTGRSILRSAYKSWFLKQLIEKIETVSLERWGVGIPVAYPSSTRRDDDAYLDRLEAILQDLRAGEFNYIVAPEPKQSNVQEGCLFEILSPSGSAPDFTAAKEYHRSEIKAALLSRFAELGHGRTGARATGDTQSIVWFAALHAVARYLCQAHEPVIKRLVDANFADVTDYPKLSVTDIEIRNLAEYAQAIAQLVSSQAITMDRTTEAAIRAGADLPDQDEQAETEPNPTDATEPYEPEVQPGDPKPQPAAKPGSKE